MIDIYNFHPGSLKFNRGSSPVNWAVLLDFKSTVMSLHRISEKIDEGELFCEHEVPIYDCDIPSTLRSRLEGEIPSMIIYLLMCRNKCIE